MWTARQLNSRTQEQQHRRIAEQLNRLSSCRKVGQSEAPTSCQAEANGTKDSSSQFVGNDIVNECEILNKMMNLCERSAFVKRARISQTIQLVCKKQKQKLPSADIPLGSFVLLHSSVNCKIMQIMLSYHKSRTTLCWQTKIGRKRCKQTNKFRERKN